MGCTVSTVNTTWDGTISCNVDNADKFLALFEMVTACAVAGTVVVSVDNSVCCTLHNPLEVKGLFLLLRLVMDEDFPFFGPFPVPLLLLGLTPTTVTSASSLALGESDLVASNDLVNSEI